MREEDEQDRRGIELSDKHMDKNTDKMEEVELRKSCIFMSYMRKMKRRWRCMLTNWRRKKGRRYWWTLSVMNKLKRIDSQLL